MPNNTQNAQVRRNLLALTGDFVSFSIGFAFFDPVVIIPAFTEILTGAEVAVGVISALRIIVITLPQLWAASILGARSRKKPLLVYSSLLGRLPILPLALGVLWFAPRAPWLVVGLLTLSVILFFSSEGLNSISWPDIVGKVLPAKIRGRFLGFGQLLSSAGALAAGYITQRILRSDLLAFPANWALLFGCAFAGLMASLGFILLIHEEPDDKEEGLVDVTGNLSQLWSYLMTDRSLRRVVITQILLYCGAAAFPFIVIRSRQLSINGDEILGTFVIAQNAGGMFAAILCGYLVDRVGSWASIRLCASFACIALALVTVAPLTAIPMAMYLTAFMFLGFFTNSAWWTFTVYLLDIADDANRANYLAASGILTSPSFLASILIGLVFRPATAEQVFGVALLFALAGLLTSLTLPRIKADEPIE